MTDSLEAALTAERERLTHRLTLVDGLLAQLDPAPAKVRAPTRLKQKSSTSPARKSAARGVICGRCGKAGHNKRSCTETPAAKLKLKAVTVRKVKKEDSNKEWMT